MCSHLASPRIRVLLIMLILSASASPRSIAGQSVRFTLYAPAQKDPPVHIVGFQHGKSEVGFVLSNTSDKTVYAEFIAGLKIAPQGCASNAEISFTRDDDGVNFRVRIPPHEEGIASRIEGIDPRWSKKIVDTTVRAGVAYRQIQFGVTAVFFEDRTAWPSDLAFLARDDFRSFAFGSHSRQEDEKYYRIVHPPIFDPSRLKQTPGNARMSCPLRMPCNL